MKSFIGIVLKIIISIFLLLVVMLLALLLLLILSESDIIKDTKNYDKCIQTVQHQNEITHFPKVIPNNVESSRLYCAPGAFYADNELVLLVLKADRTYIEKELKSHSFLNPNTPIGSPQKLYNTFTDWFKLPSNNFTYYVVKNKSNFNEGEDYFPYFSGIAVDKDMNYILYYYINPD